MTKCPDCGSNKHIIKYGKTKEGGQRFHCKGEDGECSTTFTLRELKFSYEEKLLAVLFGELESTVIKKRDLAKIIGCATGTPYRWKKREIIARLRGAKVDWEGKIDLMFQRSGMSLDSVLKNNIINEINKIL